MDPVPFRVHATEAQLDELRRRVTRAVLPDQDVPNGGWEYGSERSYVESLARYWVGGYDWRAWEKRLNEAPQFTLSLPAEAGNPGAGLRMHFVHRKGRDGAVPLLLLHGWPGSFFEFHKVLPLLGDDFHVVAPSLPGYGFSGRPTTRGFDVAAIARTVDLLMRSLGYPRYVAQGGDWGGAVCKMLGVLCPATCKAIHVNMLVAAKPKQRVALSAADLAQVKRGLKFQAQEVGYQKIQGTKPQTLGYALADSPVGLMAWIAEKFRAWSYRSGELISADELLTNVMVYWLSGCITSSCRLYYESLGTGAAQGEWVRNLHSYCSVPTGHAEFPAEPFTPPRPWAEVLFNIKHWSKHERGGHFAALEVPELLSADVRQFFLSTVDAGALVAQGGAKL
eukprot:TRINITY_DN1610_c4_g1_i1.p2 TRINITY_DN1610_c4_g1~~TRINITY_DN1610_c4_g1_i1.p2  ORF type:complete len:408 (+),score=135.08 TRINITY_DN1610_c4_g1_i1:48-1226(+)